MKKFLTVFAAVAALSLAACGQVDTGNRGVLVNYGKVVGTTGEGLQWYNPITTDLNQVSVKTMAWESQTDIYTKDVQQAKVKFKLTYHLNPASVEKVYSTVGTDWAAVLIPQVVQQSVKNVFGQARAVEDAINNRQAVTSLIFADITKKLAAKNILVDGFEIQDVGFAKAFEESVERKQIAVQDAETAKNQTVRFQEEARQKVIAAKADAESMSIKTAALAGSPKLVEYEAVQKWDGVLPTTIYGGTIPFVKSVQ